MRILPQTILLASVFFMASLSGQSNAWDGLINRSVDVKFCKSDDINYRTFELVDFQERRVLLRFPGDRNGGMIGFPLVEFQQGSLFIRVEPEGNLEAGLDIIAVNGDMGTVIPLMRPTVWPLIKFMALPRSSTNFHTLVEAYFKALIAEGLVDEAFAIVNEFDFNQIDVALFRNVMGVVDLLLEKGREEDAGRLLARLPLENPALGLQEVAMQIGDRLRMGGFFGQAIGIYERIYTLPETRFREKCLLWISYCYMEEGNFDSAKIFLGLVGNIDRRLPEYSLMKLVESKIYFEENQIRDAMTAVSQGIVFSRLGLEWSEELMFTSAKAYEAVERPWVAEKIYEELILFYPSSSWSDQARRRLQELETRDRSNDPVLVPEENSEA